jgi:hypothetical protein
LTILHAAYSAALVYSQIEELSSSPIYQVQRTAAARTFVCKPELPVFGDLSSVPVVSLPAQSEYAMLLSAAF